MDKVQKYNSFNTNTPSSESYRDSLLVVFLSCPQGFSNLSHTIAESLMCLPVSNLFSPPSVKFVTEPRGM
jgi:hypothetical protein